MQLAIRLKLHRWSPLHSPRATLPFKRRQVFFFSPPNTRRKSPSKRSFLTFCGITCARWPRRPVVFPSGNIRPVVGDSTCVLNKFQVPTAPTPTPPPLDLTNTLLTTKYRQSRGEGHFHHWKTVVTPPRLLHQNPLVQPPVSLLSFGFWHLTVSLDQIKD